MKFKNSISLIILTILLSACATVVRPTGGPKDTTPPIVISSNPEDGSKNMHKSEIVIKFDEYVILKQLSKQMVVSPQMPEKPIVSISGKKLIIKLPDSLRENTTYTIFFGDAVVNFKENLPVHNFSYVFSTGDIVDSLQLQGVVVNSFDHSTHKDLFVMLYKSSDDSVLYKNTPYYLTKAESNGNFYLNNLSPGKYQIYALKDNNRNYIFDQITEEVAFYDSLVIPYHPSDYINLDSTVNSKVNKKPDPINLFTFKEEPKETKFLTKKIYPPHKVLFTFNRSVDDFRIKALDFTPDSVWHFDVYGLNKDSITSYLLGINKDTINVALFDGNTALDTLELVLIKKKRKNNSRSKGLFGKRAKEEKKDTVIKKAIPKISFTHNASGSFPFFSDIELKFKVPISGYNFSKIELYKKKDTLWLPIKVKAILSDTIRKQRIKLKAMLEERKSYKLLIRDSCFFDLYNATNDTLETIFTTTELREYGSLIVNIKYKDKYPLIVQLLNSKDAIIREDIIFSNDLITYPYLVDGKYKIKGIIDRNLNGKWDSGDLIKKIQPEQILYINNIIDIRSNWDNEQLWEIDSN